MPGPVIVWDRGTYENLTRSRWPGRARAGHASFRLDGDKLHGGWSLRRTEAAQPRGCSSSAATTRRTRGVPGQQRAALGVSGRTVDELRSRGGKLGRRAIEPMKAILSDQPFSDPDWIFERKLDGIRCIAHPGRLRR